MSTHAMVSKIDFIREIPGADNIVHASISGFNIITSKDAKVGDRGVLFLPDTQLSLDYANNNSLIRTKQPDGTYVGYLEDNCRIRALKLRGVKSEGLFMPLESVKYTGVSIDKLVDGLILRI